MRLCLNMIVKNERSNLERALAAVAPYVDAWVIADTGSTDGTQAFIHEFFRAQGIPGELHQIEFLNFGQARNEALAFAQHSTLPFDYVLLQDADMELVVEQADFKNHLTASCYTVRQRDGISYWNRRLLRRDLKATYRGVTHEYLDITPDADVALERVWFKDHASGFNRTNKHQRDIALLEQGLQTEPDNARYWFYLAQAYRYSHQYTAAAKTYGKRAQLGGFAEEVWYARLQEARCFLELKDESSFLRAAMVAYNLRPQRAEPLYDLAKYYRQKGGYPASLVYASAGLTIPYPSGDQLFIEDYAYVLGLREEFSIAAFYSPNAATKEQGFLFCNALSLNRQAPASTRELAFNNLLWYTPPIQTLLPSFKSQEISFDAPTGYRAMNPSITRRGKDLVLLQRTVNYLLTAAGTYEMTPGAPIHTRNFLLTLSDDFAVNSAIEVLPPADLPSPRYLAVRGFEDSRVFEWQDQLWCVSCVRELTKEGWCEQVLAKLGEPQGETLRLESWRTLQPDGARLHQKNWMPHTENGRLSFVYACDPTRWVDQQGKTLVETTPPLSLERFRGGSQLIRFHDGWLALIHEVARAQGLPHYRHRFAYFSKDHTLVSMSLPFTFAAQRVEFAAGLAWHPDGERLVISYGVADQQSFIATVVAAEVGPMLQREFP
jgi:glycosyltransferase involved in cell wall biosynthesis